MLGLANLENSRFLENISHHAFRNDYAAVTIVDKRKFLTVVPKTHYLVQAITEYLINTIAYKPLHPIILIHLSKYATS